MSPSLEFIFLATKALPSIGLLNFLGLTSLMDMEGYLGSPSSSFERYLSYKSLITSFMVVLSNLAGSYLNTLLLSSSLSFDY